MTQKILSLFVVVLLTVSQLPAQESAAPEKNFRLGIIGTTTSHVNAFVKVLNDPAREGIFREFEVTGAYAGGMPDNSASWGRLDKIKEFVVEKGIKIYPTIASLVGEVDGILLLSVDGRCHLEQAKPVIKAGKPLFIDKPAAASLGDAMEIYRLAAEAKVPVFSSSSLRFSQGFLAARAKKGDDGVLGATTWSPSTRNPLNPGLFWYGIHGVEILFTVMGSGCERVSCIGSDDWDLATGVWSDGRIGCFRGYRTTRGGYGAILYGKKGATDAGTYEGYKPLVEEFCKFFKTGISPVDAVETLEVMAFMEAAGLSLDRGGEAISIKELMDATRARKRTVVNLQANEAKQLTLDGKALTLDKLAGELDRLGADADVKVVLSVKGAIDNEFILDVCNNLGKATLANFLHE